MEIVDAKNCGGENQVVKMINVSFNINEKCEVSSQSCSIIRPFKTASVKKEALWFPSFLLTAIYVFRWSSVSSTGDWWALRKKWTFVACRTNQNWLQSIFLLGDFPTFVLSMKLPLFAAMAISLWPFHQAHRECFRSLSQQVKKEFESQLNMTRECLALKEKAESWRTEAPIDKNFHLHFFILI